MGLPSLVIMVIWCQPGRGGKVPRGRPNDKSAAESTHASSFPSTGSTVIDTEYVIERKDQQKRKGEEHDRAHPGCNTTSLATAHEAGEPLVRKGEPAPGAGAAGPGAMTQPFTARPRLGTVQAEGQNGVDHCCNGSKNAVSKKKKINLLSFPSSPF